MNKCKENNIECMYAKGSGACVMDMGCDEARAWLVKHDADIRMESMSIAFDLVLMSFDKGKRLMLAKCETKESCERIKSIYESFELGVMQLRKMCDEGVMPYDT